MILEAKKGLEEAPSLGIYADPGMIMQRGIARELKEGKRYHRSHKKLVASFENLQHAIQMASRSLTQAILAVDRAYRACEMVDPG